MGASALYLVPWLRHHVGADGNACLPSSDAALDFVRSPGTGSGLQLLWTMGLRSVLVAGGLALAGVHGTQLLVATVSAVGAIEVGVLIWALNAQHAPLSQALSP